MMFWTASLFSVTFTANLNNLTKREKFEIIKGFWEHTDLTSESFKEGSYISFLQYLGEELGCFRHYQRHFAVQNLEDLLEVLRAVRRG